MLEHQSEETPETGYVYHQPEHHAESVLSAESSAESSEEIEDYLDQVTAPLVGILPRSKRQAIRENVRGRLDSMIAAHQELGETHEAAIQAAIRQSGDPTLISQRWVTETHSQTNRQVKKQVTLLNHSLEARPSARFATLTALGLFGVPYLGVATDWAWRSWETQSQDTISYYRFFMFAVPLLAGLATGLVARNRPVRGVLNALAIMTIPAIAIPGFVLGLDYTKLIFDNSSHVWSLVLNPLPGLCGLLPWLAMGCLGAGIGHSLHTRTAKLRTRLGRQFRLKRLERKEVYFKEAL